MTDGAFHGNDGRASPSSLRMAAVLEDGPVFLSNNPPKES